MSQRNHVSYRMIKTTAQVEDSGAVTVYGICCREKESVRHLNKVKFQVIANISTDPLFVEILISLLTNYDADPVHLQDFIQDQLP